MARWIFKQVNESQQARLSNWTWELQRTHGAIVRRSATSFTNLKVCMDDASKYGYYGGHYAVYINSNSLPIINVA